MADLTGCSQRFVHTVEHGKTSLRLDKVLDFLVVLGLGLRVVPGRGRITAAGVRARAVDSRRRRLDLLSLRLRRRPLPVARHNVLHLGRSPLFPGEVGTVVQRLERHS